VGSELGCGQATPAQDVVRRGPFAEPELPAGGAELAELYLAQTQKLLISRFYFSLRLSEKVESCI